MGLDETVQKYIDQKKFPKYIKCIVGSNTWEYWTDGLKKLKVLQNGIENKGSETMNYDTFKYSWATQFKIAYLQAVWEEEIEEITKDL